MEQFAPKQYAVEHDRIGLQLGTLNKPVTKVVVTLDVTIEVVYEAIAAGAELIIAHHAIIFRPLAKLDTSTPAGQLYELLIKNDIAVYISHTNLDVAEGGVNDLLADQAGMVKENRKVLEPVYTESLYKLIVYVPSTHLDAVQQAVWLAGAGQMGNYSHCSYQSEGIGTFLPEQGSNPYAGKQGLLAKEAEVKFETIVPEGIKRKVIAAMIKAHPYEEVAYDVLALQQPGKVYGLGRAGKLLKTATLGELAERLKVAFQVPYVRVVGDLNKEIAKIAVLGGSGAKYVKAAKFAGADILITGDIDFHTAHDALADGMTIIDAGHHIEKVMIKGVTEWLAAKCEQEKAKVQIIPSQIHTEVFTFL